MIVNVRGAHGAGKTTLVRKIMDTYPTIEPDKRPFGKRKNPWGYWCFGSDRLVDIYVPGHYETPCGGCDTISRLEDTYNLITEAATTAGVSVLFEGILLQHSPYRFTQLCRAHQVRLVMIDVPLDTCVEGVNARRAKRGAAARPLKHVVPEHARCRRDVARLEGKQVCPIYRADRLHAEHIVLELLGR